MDPTLEAKLTLEPTLDLNHILESVLIPEPFILEPKSTISPSHILLLDQGIDYNGSEMIFQDCSYEGDNFLNPVRFGDNKNINRKKVIKGGFFKYP